MTTQEIIDKIFKDKELRCELSKNAKKLRDEFFSYELIAQKTLNDYFEKRPLMVTIQAPPI